MMYLRFKLHQFKQERAKVNEIYNEVIDKLRTQTQFPIKYVGSNQLRDLLILEDNLAYKLRLWNKVSHKIENNANISYRLIEYHGEIIKVWEWLTV